MKLYKYRKCTEINHAFDIILNQRLYCAPAGDMNDPLEGLYIKWDVTENGHNDMWENRKFPECWNEYRIVSLAKEKDNLLLWVHYASAFSGLVLEVEIPDNTLGRCEVRYNATPRKYVIDSMDDLNRSKRESLEVKNERWMYEGECRIITEDEWFDLPEKVSMVVLGHKMDDATKMAMKIVAKECGISVKTTRIDLDGVKIVDG